MFRKLALLTVLTVALTGCGKAPTKELVRESIKNFIPLNFEVLQVSKLDQIPGLYEVVIKVNNQPVVVYVDKKAKFIFSGSIMSTETKQNLTLEAQKKFLPK